MVSASFNKTVEILLVEDNPGDARLAVESLKESRVTNETHVVEDGVEAMNFLRHKGKYTEAIRPDLILLDLNMPKKDGREVLAEIKTDQDLRLIPVVILTMSTAEEDIQKCYYLHANCYITKPIDLDEFMTVIKTIESFWMTLVKLPPQNN